MGIFTLFDMKDLLLTEAEDDEEDTAAEDNTNDTPAEDNQQEDNQDTEDNEDDNADENQDDNEDDNQEEETEDNETEEEDNTEEDDNQFDINADDDTSNEGGDEGGTDSGGGNEDEIPETEDKKKDREIYDSLTPYEQKVKNSTLKKLYMELYSNCDYIIDKMNTIDNSEIEKVSVQFKKTLSIMHSLRQMVSDYILNTYDTKTYIENDIMFNRYLAILNSVKSVTTSIKNDILNDDDKK